MLCNEPPFELGETLQGTDSAGNLINAEWLGQIFEFPAKSVATTGPGDTKKRRCGRSIKAMAVRNVSGAKLYGKRLCLLDATTAGAIGSTGGIFATKGYATTTGEANVAVIDEFLATTGVADDDIFWAVLEGPVIIKTQATAAAAGTIAAGDKLIAGTGAATSGNSTAGGVGTTSAPLVTQIIGTALSAMNSASTQQDCLVMAAIRFV